MIEVTPRIVLQDSELEFAHVRSSGPGGQNVNKVATACELRLNVRASPSIPEEVKIRLAPLAGRRLTKDGELIIVSERFRSQEMNRQDAIERLVALLREAAKPPPPKRKVTKPTRGATERRLAGKTLRSGVKKLRSNKPQAE